MTQPQMNSSTMQQAVEVLTANGLEGMVHVMAMILNETMQIERSKAIGAGPYERSDGRKDYANGFKDRTLKTRLGLMPLRMPQVRGQVDFYPSALERGLRSERALTNAIAEMYVQGVSTRRVSEICEKLCGFEVSSADVSRAAGRLDGELEQWRTRPLGRAPWLILDATYERVRVDGVVRSCAVLVATGVTEDGHRSVLGVSVSLSEAEAHWRAFLRSLKERGLHGVEYIVSDDHEGLKKSLGVFGQAIWCRCQVHLQRNAVAYVPRRAQRKLVAEHLRHIFNAPDREEAERLLEVYARKWEKPAPELAAWMRKNIPEGFGAFTLPAQLRRKLRSNNAAERLNREIKRRTRVAVIFPNTPSVERLISAILMEVSEEWENGKRYFTTKTQTDD